MFEHDEFQMFGVTEWARWDFWTSAHDSRCVGDFRVTRMGMVDRTIIVDVHDVMSFSPIDAMPHVLNEHPRMIRASELSVFAPALARTQEIIVEPGDVARLLERIKEVQAPEQAAIRARNRLRERMDGQVVPENMTPRQTFHAQILSIAA